MISQERLEKSGTDAPLEGTNSFRGSVFYVVQKKTGKKALCTQTKAQSSDLAR